MLKHWYPEVIIALCINHKEGRPSRVVSQWGHSWPENDQVL